MTASLAAELKALADLKADGTLTPEQFERAKEVVLSGDAIPDAPADGDDDEPRAPMTLRMPNEKT